MTPSPSPAPSPLPDRIWLPRDLDRAGVTADTRGPDGEPVFERVRRGAHASKATWEELDARGRYLALLSASSAMLAREPVLSHHSAAAVWGLPILGRWPTVLHQIVHGDTARSTAHLVRHRSTHPVPGERRGEFLVTAAARTVVDLTSCTTFASGLMATDHALAAGLVTRAELDEELASRPGLRGVRRVRAVVTAADRRSESPGESLSRARMVQARLPAPILQQEFHDDDGFVGRCDFYWKQYRLVGEFDGRSKYGREIGATESPEERVWREKMREDRLRALGLGVVRWVWDDALRGEPLVRALARHGVRAERIPARGG